MTSSATSSEIIAAVSAVIGDVPRPVALHEPLFAGNENTYVKSCIDEGWVSSVGAFVNRFEKDLADLCGAPRAVAVVNGTCAIHAALMVMGIKQGDEVIIPALTFVATANAVVHAGAVPHFVDVEETSLGMDPQALVTHLENVATRQGGQTVNKLTGRPIRALMPVHIFGHPCRLEELAAVAREWNLMLLEDATEALGSTHDGRPVGSRHTAVFSFNGNKMITTGGGGAVTTHDEELYHRLKHLTTTAKQSHQWAFLHDQVGYNYRMRAFDGMKGVRILPAPPSTESNYWLVSLVADQPVDGWLDATLQALHDAGLQCRPIWQPLHMLPMYREHPRADLSRTESLARRLISLPSSVKLGLPLIGG